MLRSLIKVFVFCILWTLSAGLVQAEQKPVLEFAKPMKDLFSHRIHSEGFKKVGISCVDCHNFAVKAVDADPLGPGVEKGLIAPNRKTCHQCHLGTVTLARPNQCVLCHRNTEQIKPSSHKQNWRFRHGKFAQADMDSCKECHTDRSCTACHTQRDSLKPMVHRPNFRLTHSIEARANPASCVVCHSTTTSCVQCHTSGVQ